MLFEDPLNDRPHVTLASRCLQRREPFVNRLTDDFGQRHTSRPQCLGLALAVGVEPNVH